MKKRKYAVKSTLLAMLAALLFLIPASARYNSFILLNYNQWQVDDMPLPQGSEYEGFDVVFTAPILVTPDSANINTDTSLNYTGYARVRIDNVPAGYFAFRVQGAHGGNGSPYGWPTNGGGGGGGHGATVSGVFFHEGGTLTVVAGRGGGHNMWDRASGNAQPGGGQATGQTATETQRSGGGGGFSGIFSGDALTQATAIAIAGGGGGGGGGGGAGTNDVGSAGGNGNGWTGAAASAGQGAAGNSTAAGNAGTGGAGGGGSGGIFQTVPWPASRDGGTGGTGHHQDGNPNATGNWIGIGGGGAGARRQAANRGGDGGRNPETHAWRAPGVANHTDNRGSALQGGNSRRTAGGAGNSAGGGGGWVGGEAGFYNGTGPGAGGGGGASFLRAGITPLSSLWSTLHPPIPGRTPANTPSAASGATARINANGYVWILYLGARHPNDATDAWYGLP
ncbi:MAG: hypothetical protein FWE40_09575 [Oscillospiraceae bacterium]|nr:hypothetical protein [Oscillospiraceae bacterium]